MNLKNLILGNISQDELLNYYNVTIEYVTFPYKRIRGLVNYYRGYYFIYINKSLSYYKKKKTILHELAHIELNQLCQQNKDLFDFFIDRYEDEANEYIKEIQINLERSECNGIICNNRRKK